MPDQGDTIAVIAGGPQGLGLAITEQLVAEGCTRIVLAGRHMAEGEAAVASLRMQYADARFVATDVGRVDEAVALLDATALTFGMVDALVNTAATTER